jgi:hypothetical protein
MKDKQCDVIRRELEDLTLNQEFSGPAAEHLRGCADCREFQRQQLKLRQIVGSLGTVDAPSDFDFRLRARLAADSDRASLRYWSFAVRGLVTVAVLVVFGVGAVVIWQRVRQEDSTAVAVSSHNEPRHPEPRPTEQPGREAESDRPGLRSQAAPVVAEKTNPRRNPGRPIVNRSRQPVASFAISSERANVVSLTQPALDPAPVFPIDASLQSVRVSLDDGRGNARTISFPAVTFGSQRVLASGNQIASQRVW